MKYWLMIIMGLGTALVCSARSGHGGSGGAVLTGSGPVTNFVPFVDELVLPPTAIAAGTTNGLPLYNMRMTVITNHQFHRDLPPVEVWGYNDFYPGPTIQAVVNAPIWVDWIDELPMMYPDWLPANTNYHGVTNQDVRNVVHLHGGANRPEYDGHPTAWFRPGESRLYLYENIDFGGDGETLWYHDHALGVTENNVYAGLSGFFLLRNPGVEQQLNLPSGAFEVPLVFQDRDIQLDPPSLLSVGVPPWHNLPVVNGKVAPYLNVEPRKYRFRMLNGSGFRTVGLAFFAGTTNIPMYQIGTDDGFLPATVQLGGGGSGPPTLRLMPAERADVIVDFSGWKGVQDIYVTNWFDPGNAAPPPGPPVNVVHGKFLQIRVGLTNSSPDTSSIPTILVPADQTAAQLAQQAVRVRTITLDLNDPQFESPPPGLIFSNQPSLLALINMTPFDEPVTETPRGGDIEVWEFVNLTSLPHPMHVHLLDFFLLDRLAFKPDGVSNYITDRILGTLGPLTNYLSGATRNTQLNELGPKDVIRAAPLAVTRIVMQWPADPRFQGPYVYHCHILDHEDNDMMRPLQVLPPLSGPALPADELSITLDAVQSEVLLQLGTAAGVAYELQASYDLTTWTSVGQVTGTGNNVQRSDTIYPGSQERFYRALAPQ